MFSVDLPVPTVTMGSRIALRSVGAAGELPVITWVGSSVRPEAIYELSVCYLKAATSGEL